MLFFAIDDEPKLLNLLHKAIAEAEPDAEIMDFTEGDDLLAALSEHTPDVVFSDVELQGMTGLELAVQIKSAAPEAKIIFVTGFSQYAADAFRLHANGYIIKPAEAGRIREELDYLKLPEKEAQPGKLRVRCFGSFEVFWQDKPLPFPRSKAKELLAYLIDREGVSITSGEIISALWEDGAQPKDAKGYLRVLLRELSAVLKSIGMCDVVLKKRGQLAVDRSKLDCDYYRMLDGDTAAVNSYRGEYMKQYSWAELTAGRLYFKTKTRL